jgi:nucleoside-triphosphatase THEP1
VQQSPLPVSEISLGLFVHTGVMELMTRGNEGAIANVVSSSEPMVASIHVRSRMARNVSASRKDTQGHVFQNEWKVDGSGI